MDDQSPDPTTRMPTPAPTDEPSSAESVVVAEEPAADDPTGATPPPAVAAPSVAPAASWEPPRTKRDGGGRLASVLVGLVLLGIGAWFFAEVTLGIDLPTIRWGQLWPIILIVIGGAIVLGALRRDRS